MSLRSLLATGTRLWLDSIDPDLVRKNAALGATGATSNPVIVSELIETGRFDADIERFCDRGLDDAAIAWAVTDALVADAQDVFRPAWVRSNGDDGYVSFELDPLLEDPSFGGDNQARAARYVELGLRWGKDRGNRMIKVPATPAGFIALEELAAAGVFLNVTLIFTRRQYEAARDAVWRGAQRRASLADFKSVYSIFISRIDVYTRKHLPTLSPATQGQVGIVNAKRLWQLNQAFWADKHTPLRQEIIFASTGTKDPSDAPDKYVEALAGSDIQTNPPKTNDAVEQLNKSYTRQVDRLPPADVLAEIDANVDQQALEDALLAEGIKKFVDPQRSLLDLIARKRLTLACAKG